ncbi:MAG: HAD-IA family hydrolase [Bacteroidota bacterium]|nr:HAD-IA family hydrolase [Bacteroidota bacterium]
MAKLKGVIFDVDGTLTSTNKLIFASFNHVSQKYLNRSFSDDELIKFFGPTEDVILKQWCGDNYESARKDYYGYYSENHSMADLYPGMLNVLNYLKEKNVLLSIYTGKGEEAANITLKKLGIFSYFDMVITGDDVQEHKPSPEGITLFLDKFNLKKENAIIIGDAPTDIIAANSAGIKVASVIWDSYAKDKVLKLKSDFVFETVSELFEFLKENT